MRRLTPDQAIRFQQSQVAPLKEATTTANVGYTQSSRIGDGPVRTLGGPLDRTSIPEDYLGFFRLVHGYAPGRYTPIGRRSEPCPCGPDCQCAGCRKG